MTAREDGGDQSFGQAFQQIRDAVTLGTNGLVKNGLDATDLANIDRIIDAANTGAAAIFISSRGDYLLANTGGLDGAIQLLGRVIESLVERQKRGG